MGEEIAIENGRISDFHGLVTLTLTSDRVILHTIMHHSSTSTYIPNFIEIEESFCVRTDVRTDIWDPLMLLGRLGGVDLTRNQRVIVRSNPAENPTFVFQLPARLSWPFRQLSSARKYIIIVSYRTVTECNMPNEWMNECILFQARGPYKTAKKRETERTIYTDRQ